MLLWGLFICNIGPIFAQGRKFRFESRSRLSDWTTKDMDIKKTILDFI